MRSMPFLSLLFVAMILAPVPVPGQDKPTTVKGTVVDTYCLVAMDMLGKSHKKCAQTCAKNGVPIGILEEKTGTIYLALSQKNMMYSPPALVEFLEENVAVSGKVHERGGMKVIVIESVTKVNGSLNKSRN